MILHSKHTMNIEQESLATDLNVALTTTLTIKQSVRVCHSLVSIHL